MTTVMVVNKLAECCQVRDRNELWSRRPSGRDDELRKSIVRSAVVASVMEMDIVEKGGEPFTADEVCRSHLQKYDVE